MTQFIEDLFFSNIQQPGGLPDSKERAEEKIVR